ncbi:deaminase domain-containing protein [Pseudomonas sp. MWU12-2029]|uniref:deaminase domain-containing protein n=1 Tax=Pseudomonas TaxID=286 RepID=UPI00399AC48D
MFWKTVAQRLGSNKGATGRIDLISGKDVCPNCTDVIRQFRDRYPKIQLGVLTVGD